MDIKWMIAATHREVKVAVVLVDVVRGSVRRRVRRVLVIDTVQNAVPNRKARYLELRRRCRQLPPRVLAAGRDCEGKLCIEGRGCSSSMCAVCVL